MGQSRFLVSDPVQPLEGGEHLFGSRHPQFAFQLGRGIIRNSSLSWLR
jgi:hypothetical protein